MANPITGTFSATGASASAARQDDFSISLEGFGTATVQLQKSYDEGATWKVVKSYTADVEELAYEPEGGIKYRLECTAWTSGDIKYRIGRGFQR